MVSRPGSRTVARQMESKQLTKNIIENPRLSNQALELLQNEDTTLEALTKFQQQFKSKKEELSKKNETIEALTSHWKNWRKKIEEIFTFTEEIDNCIFDIDKMVKRLSTAKDELTHKEETPLKMVRSNKHTPESRR